MTDCQYHQDTATPTLLSLCPPVSIPWLLSLFTSGMALGYMLEELKSSERTCVLQGLLHGISQAVASCLIKYKLESQQSLLEIAFAWSLGFIIGDTESFSEMCSLPVSLQILSACNLIISPAYFPSVLSQPLCTPKARNVKISMCCLFLTAFIILLMPGGDGDMTK